MEVFPISILTFSKFPQDGNSILIPGKLFMAARNHSEQAHMPADGKEAQSPTGKDVVMDYPVQLKDMSFSLICTGGKATVRINLVEYVLTRGTSCSVIPESFFQITEATEDFAGIVIAMVRNFFDYTNNVNVTMKALYRLIDSPVVQFSESVLNEFMEISDMMIRKLSDSTFLYKEEVAKAYLTLMKYISFQAHTEERQNSQSGQHAGRREEIFHKFIAAVEHNYKKERNVMFYADKLCISPKYLSSVIHEVSGRYATDWINGYVILEAKVLLRRSDINIKEVCSMLNFSNQSFFAKYFKQHTGMTPREFRNKN